MLNYINVFRALAIILIVLGHSFFIENRIFGKVVTEIFSSGTVLFVFISGFLFQHLSYKYETKTYYKKKFLNVISPYLITSIPGIIICFLVPSLNPFYGLSPFIQIPIFLSTGAIHNSPTWYIPMTCGFFVLAPILLFLERKRIKNFKLLYLLLPLFLLITVACQRTGVDNKFLVHSDYTYMQRYLMNVNFIFSAFVNLFSIYVLGMFFSAHKDKIKTLYNHKIFLFILMILVAVADVILCTNHLYVNGTLSKAFLVLIILGYLEHYDEQIIAHTKINHIADIIAKYSFAIFFIHRYLIKLLTVILQKFNIARETYIYNGSTCIKAFLIFLAFFTFAFCGSLILAWIIKKLCQICKIKNTRAVIGA